MFSISKTVFKIIVNASVVSALLLNPAVARASEFGVITASRLNMRSGPDRKSPSIKILTKGTRVRILKHVNGWLEIYHAGQTGFISNRGPYVRIVSEENQTLRSNGRDRSLEAVQGESRKIEQEIKKRKQAVEAFSREETALIERLNDIDISLNNAGKNISAIKTELTALEGPLAKTAAAVKSLVKRIEKNEKYVSRRLVAMYKLKWMGSAQILASSESMYDFVLRKAALERILAHDEEIRNDLLSQKALLLRLMGRLNTQKAEKVALERAYEQEVQNMSREKAGRNKLLAAIRSKRSLESAAIASLKQAAAALDRTIADLGREGRTERRQKKPLQNDFLALKGSLKMPVKGTVASRFGAFRDSTFNLKGFRSGIHIKADRGEPIHAVHGGKIIYSSWFKGYGNMMIIDHGGSYYTVYAHAEELFKVKGDTVEKQEVIATVGDSGSMTGPRLYFEMRHHGKPLDPLVWINTG